MNLQDHRRRKTGVCLLCLPLRKDFFMKKNLYILYAIALLQGMVFYGPIATLYRQAQGVSVLEITIIESVSLALGILLEVPWGVLADRIGYRRTMIFCSGLYFVSKIVFWLADGFAGFLLERVLLGVVLAGFSGVDSSILYLSCQEKDSQKAFGIYNSMSMAGLLIAVGVFSLLVQDNYSLAGFLTVISYGLAALLSLGLTEVKEAAVGATRPESFRTTLQSTLHHGTFLLFLVGAAFLSETHQTITVFLNQLQYTRCGMSSAAMGILYMVGTLMGLLGVYSAAVSNRLGTRGALFLFCGLAAASCLVLAVTAQAIPSVMGILTLRLSNTLFQPLHSETQNRQIQTENRATVLSIHSMLISCIAIGTNLIFGALSDWNLPAAFFFGGSICLLGLIFFLVWYRKSADRAASPLFCSMADCSKRHKNDLTSED